MRVGKSTCSRKTEVTCRNSAGDFVLRLPEKALRRKGGGNTDSRFSEDNKLMGNNNFNIISKTNTWHLLDSSPLYMTFLDMNVWLQLGVRVFAEASQWDKNATAHKTTVHAACN